MKKILKRYLLFVVGLYFLSAGIVLILRSSLGTTPISSVNYVLSLNTGLFVRDMDIPYQSAAHQVGPVLVCTRPHEPPGDTGIEFCSKYPFQFLFGLFIDVNMVLTETLQPQHYILSIVLLLLGCLIQAVGVVLEIKPRVAMMSAEGFVSYASRRYNKDFGKMKVLFDVSLVTLALVLSLVLAHKIEGVREGTIIAACITGYIVSFLSNRILTRATLRKILPAKISI